MSPDLIIMTVLASVAASIITTNVMAGQCFKSIDRYFNETLEEVKKITLDALEKMKSR